MKAVQWWDADAMMRTGIDVGLLSLVSAFEDGVLVLADEISSEDAERIEFDICCTMRTLLDQTGDVELLEGLVADHFTHPRLR